VILKDDVNSSEYVKAEEEEEEGGEVIVRSIGIRLLVKTVLTNTEVTRPAHQSWNINREVEIPHDVLEL
jgi:hypothetical protein